MKLQIVSILALTACLHAATPLYNAGDNVPEIRAFLNQARERHGEIGAKCARFLVDEMPSGI